MRFVSIGRVLLVGLVAVTGCLRESPMEHIFRLEDARSTGRGALVRYLGDRSGGVRTHAIRAAGRLADPRLVPHLVPGLDDPDPAVAREAAFALGQIALIHPEERAGVAKVLGARFRDGATRPPTVRMELVAAMGKTGTAAPVDLVGDALEDVSVEVRRGALLAAGRLGDAVPLAPLLTRVHDEDTENRWRAVHALVPHRDDEATRALIDRLEDGDALVRRMAALALATRPGPEVVDALSARLQGREWDRGAQAAVVHALTRVSTDDTVPLLAPFVHALYPEVRAEAATAVARFGGRFEVDAVVSLAEDHRALVRHRIVAALERHPDPRTGEALARLADDEVPAVRAAARVALARRERRSLLPLLDDPIGEVRVAAAWSLGVDGAGASGASSRKVARALRGAMADPDARVAAAATTALARVLARDPDALDGGASTLGGTHWVSEVYAPGAAPEVKRAVLDGFESLGAPEPCALVPVLSDGDDGVRRRAYTLLESQLDAGGGRAAPCVLPDRRAVWVREAPLSSADARRSLESLPRECTIVTTRGAIYVDLARRDAPRAVAYLVDLARSGGLDGAGLAEVIGGMQVTLAPGTASRVMPGAGPRPEISPIRITRGSVLLLGPDAEHGGSRLRFVLTPDPSLDGRQTVIGSVSHGWEILTMLDLDDRILTITVG